MKLCILCTNCTFLAPRNRSELNWADLDMCCDNNEVAHEAPSHCWQQGKFATWSKFAETCPKYNAVILTC